MFSRVLLAAVVAVAQTPPKKQDPPRRPEIELDAVAVRGIGGVQSEGWQHVALQLNRHTPADATAAPVTGRATLFELGSQSGARPRLTLPFTVTDRQTVHFYMFRPPKSLQSGAFVITLESDDGKPITFSGAEQTIVHAGQSRRGVRVTMGDEPSGTFRVALWGTPPPLMRQLVSEWDPRDEDLARAGISGMRINRQRQLQIQTAGGLSNFSPQPLEFEQPRLLPDSYLGWLDVQMLFLFDRDIDQQLTEPQRQALADWVRSGGMLVFVPGRLAQLQSNFWRELAGIRPMREQLADDDKHLASYIEPGGAPHRPLHFFTTVEAPHATRIDTPPLVLYQDEPVVYSVPAGFGRVWIVAFDPTAHGGVGRYKKLWIEILNQTLAHSYSDGTPQVSPASQAWTFDGDRQWLDTLSSRFGRYPTIESLAILILCYLVVMGPVNSFVLKRREARMWFIVTVPALAVLCGGAVLASGYYTHGPRAATNQAAFALVTPEGDRAFVDEFVGVYGATSGVYRLGFPRSLPVRPVGEFVANQNQGYENPATFSLTSRDDRLWLDDWRLSFWQTRGVATTECVSTGGRLTAEWKQNSLVVSNQTPLELDSLQLLRFGGVPLGTIKPYQDRSFEDLLDELRSSAMPGTVPEKSKFGSTNAPPPSAPTQLPAKKKDDSASATVASKLDEETSSDDIERRRLVAEAMRRLSTRDRDWIIALSRQPVHAAESPDARKSTITTLYAWPVNGKPPDADKLPRR